MSTPLASALQERLAAALSALDLPPDGLTVTEATDARFGDYQTNAAMMLAKKLKKNPRELATALVEKINAGDLCESVSIAGAGFINFRLRSDILSTYLADMARTDRLGVPTASSPERIIIDFSSPNIAKPMHVGHIRSTIIGDCLARVARFLGHDVITDNHLGDWGAQFGKVIYGWKHILDQSALSANPITELVRIYREVNRLEEQDPTIRDACRRELVLLQQGDEENLAIWRRTVELSRGEFQKIYDILNVHFDEWLGESFYNARLGPLVERLLAAGIAEPSEGAICIFFRDIPALADKPCIIRKSDGGFLYATTDLATIEYRVERWNPTAIWYVTGAPQQLHFQQVFAAAERMGYHTALRHIPFGSILGEDRKIMRTRAGENVGLVDVLDEAIERARAIIEEKNPSLSAEEKQEVATLIGVGAVKYAELSQHRLTDYVFSWQKMLSFEGNTAPYLQNACVRIRSIFRKAEVEPASCLTTPIHLEQPEERDLAMHLARFAEAVPAVLTDFRPNLLASYLYKLATTFHGFYEACPVLKSDEPVRSSRLALCALTERVFVRGLDLLGIGVPQRM